MNRIFIDIGNSRIKYAISEDGHYEYLGAELTEDFLSNIDELLFAEFNQIDEVYFSTVGNQHIVEELKSLIHEAWQLIPIQLSTQKSCCGLQSGYKDFHKLGSDRWMAMLGGLSMTQMPYIVVDAGTALTVDAVVDGMHKGGFIVPGLRTMRHSLANGAALLEMTDEDDLDEEADTMLAKDTAGGILAGTLYMSASFINHLIADLNHQVGTQFKVLLTGGDAVQLASLLDCRFAYVPDLVLLGMVHMVESVKNR
ncbi:type III pantothenate kinase [Thiomicrorhabdus xiamenensis]|uniref:Type III pantothenate kinase n=1 Tax=Thiomicrorhabdus xiamenensis TaxID=2739063 RepID=A0A7D4TD04_9GAMM|nr:type III pantothenate kinase [Thiomicrorhabdus xiamenensis]QKI88347.1 type III pantothenate kinase [Thiomicrorhabdus xiamenensis]